MIPAEMATWFASAHRPLEAPNADFVLGATHLLRDFLATAEAMPGAKRLLLVAPFIDRTLLEKQPLFESASAQMTDLQLITTPAQTRGTAVQAVTGRPWKSCEVCALPGLHTKLYVARPAQGMPVALLGSHNLTVAGAFSNHELGVLVQGRSANGRAVIARLEEHFMELRARSQTFVDSLLPFPHAA